MFHYSIDQDTEARLMIPEDAEAYFTLIDSNRTHLAPWLPWVESCLSAEDRMDCLEAGLDFPESGWCDVGIWHAGTLAGVVGFHRIEPNIRSATFHYFIGAAYEGRGLITRTCRALVDDVFTRDLFNRLVITVVVENTRSLTVPERLGFHRDGVLRQVYEHHGRLLDMAVYAMLREDWAATAVCPSARADA
ncbi:MAG TPA: GNAT family protein [Armatimonadota bacterium]